MARSTKKEIVELNNLIVELKAEGTTTYRKKAITARILTDFDGIFRKYADLFSDGHLTPTSDTRQMMYLIGGKQAKNIALMRHLIKTSLSHLEYDDIKADLQVKFLEVLDRYHIVEGVDALGFLLKAWRWKVLSWYQANAKPNSYNKKVSIIDREFEDGTQSANDQFDDYLAYDNVDLVDNRLAIAMLPEIERKIFQAYYVDELSLKAIAKAMDWTTTKVRATIDHIDDLLTDSGEDDDN